LETDNIDLAVVLPKIWKRRIFLVKVVSIFIVFGLFVAFFSEKEFTAGSTFIPQSSDTKLSGSFGGIASLAGLNSGVFGDNSTIPPGLYPKIIGSVQFQMNLLNAPFIEPNTGDSMTYRTYYENVHRKSAISYVRDFTIGLPWKLMSLIRKNEDNYSSKSDQEFLRLSFEEKEHLERLSKQLGTTVNDREGFVSITFKMPDNQLAAQMAFFTQELLQKELIEFKIQNAQTQLDFTERSVAEKESEFRKAQLNLANFLDGNQNLNSAIAKNQLQHLQSEYDIAYNIYSELRSQSEQAKLQVSRDTPVFTVIQPVTIPAERSSPRRILILFFAGIFGVLVAITIVLSRDFVLKIKKQIVQK